MMRFSGSLRHAMTEIDSRDGAPRHTVTSSIQSASYPGIQLPFTMATAIMDPSTISREVVVGLEEGLHLTPMRAVTLLAEQFACEISIHKGDRAVDAKSMLDLMTLMAEHGTPLVLTASGPDAAAAIQALGDLFDCNFRPSST